MPAVTRNIGLSLGADICWPLAFEQILEDSKLALRVGKDTVSFACERVSLRPFALEQGCKYDVVVDRVEPGPCARERRREILDRRGRVRLHARSCENRVDLLQHRLVAHTLRVRRVDIVLAECAHLRVIERQA